MAKSTFSGDLAGGFSLATLNNQFGSLFQGDSSPLRPRAQTVPDLTVAVASSLVESYYSPIWLLGTAPLNYAGGNSGNFAVPANNRIDLLYITSAGVLTIKQGVDQASPVAPDLDADGFPICYVYCKSTMTKVVDYEDTGANPNEGYIWKDVRVFGFYRRLVQTSMGGSGQDFSATAQGNIIYFSGAGVMAVLGPGTSDYVLATKGAGQNPAWIAVMKSGDAAGGDLTGTYPNPTLGGGAVEQATLKTTTGEVSVTGNFLNSTLPGGEYGFYPQIKADANDGAVRGAVLWGLIENASPSRYLAQSGLGTSYITNISIAARTAGDTIYAKQRYVTASGKDHWTFILYDKVKKEITAGWEATDHPSYGQGGDETEIPHPFVDYWNKPLPANLEIILLDNSKLNQIKLKVTRNRGILQVIQEEYDVDELSNPVYQPREIIEIDEWGDRRGTVIKTYKNKTSFGKTKTLKRRMVNTLPAIVQYRELRLKTP